MLASSHRDMTLGCHPGGLSWDCGEDDVCDGCDGCHDVRGFDLCVHVHLLRPPKRETPFPWLVGGGHRDRRRSCSDDDIDW